MTNRVEEYDNRVNYILCKRQPDVNKRKKVLLFGVYFHEKTDVVPRMYNSILKDNWENGLSPYHRFRGMFQAEVDTPNRFWAALDNNRSSSGLFMPVRSVGKVGDKHH